MNIKFLLSLPFILLVFISQAQTNDEVLIFNQKWSDLDEVQFAYRDKNIIRFAKKEKKSSDYLLTLNYDDARLIMNDKVIGNLVMVKKDGKYGFMNTKGKKIIPLEYDFALPITAINANGEANVIVKKDKKYGAINIKNKTILPFEYDKIYQFQFNRVLCFKNNKYQFLNRELVAINADQYDDAFDFKPTGVALVILNGKYGLIDSTGKALLPMQYDKVRTFSDISGDRYFEVTQASKCGIADSVGNIIVPIQYDKVSFLPYQLLTGSFRGWDYYSKGKEDYIKFCNQGKFLVKKGNNEEIFDLSQNKTFGSGYSKLSYWGNSRVIARNTVGKYGVIDASEKNIVPFKYDSICCMVFNRSVMRIGNYYGVLGFEGTECAEAKFDRMDNADDYNHNFFGIDYGPNNYRTGYLGKNCQMFFHTEEEENSMANRQSNASSSSGSSSRNNSAAKAKTTNESDKFTGQVYFHFDSKNKARGERLYIHSGSNASSVTSTGVGSEASIKCQAGKVYYSFTGQKKDMILITEISTADCNKKFFSGDFVK